MCAGGDSSPQRLHPSKDTILALVKAKLLSSSAINLLLRIQQTDTVQSLSDYTLTRDTCNLGSVSHFSEGLIMRYRVEVGEKGPVKPNWTDKYLGSDHHTDRHVWSKVHYEDTAGVKYPGRQIRLLQELSS